LPLNVGFLEDSINEGEIKNGDYILNYGLSNNILVPKMGIVKIDGVIVKIESISRGDNYLLLKVIH
jgi:hypothetical protein